MPLEVVNRNNFAAELYYLKAEITFLSQIFTFFHVFDPQMRAKSEVGVVCIVFVRYAQPSEVYQTSAVQPGTI